MKYSSMHHQISLVATMKYTSISRLELVVVLSTKMFDLVKKELGLTDIKVYYWTDSQFVIGKF